MSEEQQKYLIPNVKTLRSQELVQMMEQSELQVLLIPKGESMSEQKIDGQMILADIDRLIDGMSAIGISPDQWLAAFRQIMREELQQVFYQDAVMNSKVWLGPPPKAKHEEIKSLLHGFMQGFTYRGLSMTEVDERIDFYRMHKGKP